MCGCRKLFHIEYRTKNFEPKKYYKSETKNLYFNLPAVQDSGWRVFSGSGITMKCGIDPAEGFVRVSAELLVAGRNNIK